MPHAIQTLDLADDGALERAFVVFTHLRPHLGLATFVRRVRAEAEEGYRIVYVEQAGEIASAAGYRIATFLAWGRVLYIDDLITHPNRKRLGGGGALLDWLLAEAQRLGCDEVHLDTGYARHDAHRLYLNKGFKMTSHHMSRAVVAESGR